VVVAHLYHGPRLSNPRTLIFPLGRVLAIGAAASALTAAASALAASPATPTVRTDRHCYPVGRPVKVTGSGFAVSRAVDVSIDGVDLGQSTTDTTGAFSGKLVPGGLGRGHAQGVDHLLASDGTSQATTTFTVTDRIGARFLVSRGNPLKLHAPFELWGFSMTGARMPIYLHYVAPSGKARKTISLGRTGGQCGYLKTGRKQFFPFAPSLGQWVLQLDSQKGYAKRPRGPVARIKVRIATGP
jgi:hypothetical protein